MKPISIKLTAAYDPTMRRLQRDLERMHPEGGVVSRTHVIRYALRMAAGCQPDEAKAKQVLVDEEGRGRYSRTSAAEVVEAPAEAHPSE